MSSLDKLKTNRSEKYLVEVIIEIYFVRDVNILIFDEIIIIKGEIFSVFQE